MIVFLNGRFVPEKQARVSVFDRAFLYGDGLFETLRINRGGLFRWKEHLARLKQGAAFLGIRVPFSSARLKSATRTLIQRNHLSNGLLRISLSRGVGRRGYSPSGANHPVLVMTTHPLDGPDSGEIVQWRLTVASLRVPAGDALATYKTCNKLANVLARAEAEVVGANEALLLNTDGHVAEAASSNLFWIEGKKIFTPPIVAGILPGVTRGVVLELCDALGFKVMERRIRPQKLARVDGVFLTLSSLGVVEVISLGRKRIKVSPVVRQLFDTYRALEKRVGTQRRRQP